MDHEDFCKRYWDLRERVRSDPEYARLTRELEALEPQYEAVLSDSVQSALLPFFLPSYI